MKIDLREQALEGALEGFVLNILEPFLQCIEQVPILRAGHIRDAIPEVRRLNDIMHFAAHLFLEFRDIVRVVRIPQRQRHTPVVRAESRIIFPKFLLRRYLIIVREIAQKEERQHVVTEIVRIHRPAQLIGDIPEGSAQLLLIGVGHGFGISSATRRLPQRWACR